MPAASQFTVRVAAADPAPRYARTDTTVEHAAQAFGFDLGPGEDLADVTVSGPTLQRASRHEFGDTKYRRIVYHGVATTRFREYLPPAIAADPEAIVRREPWTDEAGDWLGPLVRDIPSSARPAAPDVVQTVPTFRWERDDAAPVRTHIRHGKAIRVWLRRPWFSSGDGEQLGVVLEPTLRLPPGWATPLDVLDRVALGPATRAGALKRAKGKGSQSAMSRTTDAAAVPPPAADSAVARAISPDAQLLAGDALVQHPGAAFDIGPIIGALAPAPTAAEIRRMLHPYVTRWGSDPVWAWRVPKLPPTTSDFPQRVSAQGGLTLEEVAPQAKVSVAGHEVYFDDVRQLWYSDIEIDNGDSYYPFVRLALARYQPHSLDGAHLSRIAMTDFMQLAPDRTAAVEVGPNAVGITVHGYSGENILAGIGQPPFSGILLDPDAPAPNTTMQAVIERRPKEIPGDLGWERVGSEVTLHRTADGFHVTWVGTLTLPEATDDLARRILITEHDTYLRDMLPSDPSYMTSPLDHVRERIVYADAFEL